MNNYIDLLRRCLAQCDEMMDAIGYPIGRQIVEDHALLLRIDIARLEEYEKTKEKVTAITANGDEVQK